jgi:hypothetical protein
VDHPDSASSMTTASPPWPPPPLGHPAWSTFLGGSDADSATGIAADRQGSAHLAGRTLSPDFPTRRPFQPALRDQDYDAFLSIIN